MARNGGRDQDLAQSAVIKTTENGREHRANISSALAEVLTNGRIARKIEDADDETLDEISRARVAPQHVHLDGLLDSWTP